MLNARERNQIGFVHLTVPNLSNLMERNVGLSLFLLLFLFLKSSLDCRVSLTSARRSKDPRRSHISPRSDCAEHRSPRSTERCRSHSESMRSQSNTFYHTLSEGCWWYVCL